MGSPADILINICDELDKLSISLNEASSGLRWMLEEIKIDHPIFSSVQMIRNQIDQTLAYIGDIYHIIWLVQSCNQLKQGLMR